MNKKRHNYRIITWSLTIILLLSLGGCGILGHSGDSGQILPDDKTQGALRVGLIVDERGINDPYNQNAWQGLQRASQDFDIAGSYVQAQDSKEYGRLLTQLKKQNCNLIFTLGSDAVPAVLEAAAQNPQIKYICLDASLESTPPSNVMAVAFRVEEPAFLAGYLCGKMTNTLVAGFISGDNKDLAQKYHYAYKAGLRYARPNCQLMKGLAATYSNVNRYKTIAELMIESNADMILKIMGKTDTGTVSVLDKAQTEIAYITKNLNEIIYDLLRQYKDNTLELKNLNLGMAENALKINYTNPDMVPLNTYNEVQKLEEKIITGELKVPRNEEEYLKFIDN
ncbi:MAG: BMP family ABC transporter substrate-binding protein [Peptococcaceae bacterium]|nr:BMP family ABC transporter substrate-binding protein [Peptococcaceae bacterium]